MLSPKRKADPRLSPNEMLIMKLLWETGGAGSSELVSRMPKPFALTTLLTYLTRLEQKGYVTREPAGRGYVFRAKVPRGRVVGRLLDEVIRQFDGRLSLVVSHFVGTRKLSSEERQRLREVLEKLEDPKP